MTEPYPRDLVGYADDLPQANWPGGARIAINFVLNVEEGSETNILHGDTKNEGGLSEVVGGRHPPGQRDLGMESLYDYGPRAGFWRILRLFKRRGLPFTAYACAVALERNPAATQAMVEHGCDFASHGWRWINHFELSEDEEREHIARAVEIIERLTGEPPRGWYCRYAPSPNTRRLLVEQGGFLYDSDSYSDDLPYWTEVDGKPHLILPYALDTNDVKFGAPAAYPSGEEFLRYITDAFDQLYEEGAETPRMLSIGMHQRMVGRPGRARALGRFLDHVMAHDKVWICRRVEIAEHWHKHHHPDGAAS